MDTECSKKKCFIITPIGDEKDPIRRHIEGIIEAAITPALGEKYEIVVAHKIYEPGSITKQIISEIYNSDLVIANITNRNPNVMYELALRHALGKPVITIAEKGTSLPADIVTERTIFYYNDAKGVLELKEDLEKAEAEIDFGKTNGPIHEVLRDIKHDAIVLQNIQKTNTDDLQPLKYIIDRLNRIEHAIIDSRRRTIDKHIPDESYHRILEAIFNYEEIDHRCHKDALINRLSQINRMHSPISIDDVIVDYDTHKISIFLIIPLAINFADACTFFKKVLSEFGFKKVSFESANSYSPSATLRIS